MPVVGFELWLRRMIASGRASSVRRRLSAGKAGPFTPERGRGEREIVPSAGDSAPTYWRRRRESPRRDATPTPRAASAKT